MDIIYDFSVDYNSIDVDYTLDIHINWMVKNNIKKYSGLLNKYLLLCWVLVDL